MSIAHFIEKIQNKPEHDKHVILWVTIVVLFGLIFFVWLTTFDLSFSFENEAVQTENQISPFESLKNMFTGVTEDIGKGYEVLTETITEKK